MAETSCNQSCKNLDNYKGNVCDDDLIARFNLKPHNTVESMPEYGFSLTHIVPNRRFCPYTVKYGSEKTRTLTYYVKFLLYAHIETEMSDRKCMT